MHNFEDIFKRTKTQYKRNKRLTQLCGGQTTDQKKLKIYNCCSQNA